MHLFRAWYVLGNAPIPIAETSMTTRHVAVAAGAALVVGLLVLARRRRSSRAAARHLRILRGIGFKTLTSEMEVAVRLAVQCGEAMLEAIAAVDSQSGLNLKDGKHGIDPQTATDLANERLVIDTLKLIFPTHAVIGEESCAAAGGKVPIVDPSVPTWIVDPIDGTQNFCTSLPLSVVSIGLCLNGAPALGVIYDPFRDELFVGVAAEGAYLNGVRMRADAKRTALDKAMVLTDVGYERSPKGARRLAACHEALLLANTFGVRIVGSTVLALAWVAAGRASAFYVGLHKKDVPKAWDWCAAKAIGDASGVVFLRAENDIPFDLTSPSVCAAGSEALAKTLRRTLCQATVVLKD